MVEGDHKPNARPVLKLRVQDVAESSGSALISVWNPGGLQEILREGKILGIVGAQVLVRDSIIFLSPAIFGNILVILRSQNKDTRCIFHSIFYFLVKGIVLVIQKGTPARSSQ